jgi:Protein of unknown function (DUF1552)
MKHTRRHILRGAGGAALGLPFLPSLASRAFAADPVPGRRPRFVAFTTEHGGIDGPNMFPDPALLTQRTALFPGHEIASGALKARLEGTDAVLSPVLRGPAAALSERLLGKMNVLRGLDIPFYIAHHTGGHLGNYARNDGNGTDGKVAQSSPFPTIDQVMAWSPSFYPQLSSIKERAIHTGNRGRLCWNWSNPSARTGAIQEVRAESSSLALFERIFVPPPTPGLDPRKPIVDRILGSYRSLREGNRRLSAADRQRLDDHLDRLAELQRRVSVVRPASCAGVAKPSEDTTRLPMTLDPVARSRRRFQLYNDVVAAAFMCGTSRIAVIGVADTFSPFSGDWHQEVAHKHGLPGPQAILTEALRLTFQASVLDLAVKLDVEEAGGFTYLDNTLLQWTQESGQHTHDSPSIPVITFGSAAGRLKTGLYVDYRRQTTEGRIVQYGRWFEYAGLPYNRWLATTLQAMGVGPAEWERGGVPGYGNPYVGEAYKPCYLAGVMASAGQMMPLLSA